VRGISCGGGIFLVEFQSFLWICCSPCACYVAMFSLSYSRVVPGMYLVCLREFQQGYYLLWSRSLCW
jgi:hypothetical protein